jgi:AraC family transcriptional regulator of adaptative response / DNA-3-methyladenine glycosylase II
LLLAKQLLTESDLPMTKVALASGFQSVRRFNVLFRKQYRLVPSEVRRSGRSPCAGEGLRITLGYRPPFDWGRLLRFLRDRTVSGVEWVDGDAYHRTVRLAGHFGWLGVQPTAGKHALSAELSISLAPVLPQVVSRLKDLFDLGARPDVVANCLGADPLLSQSLVKYPGLRVPGAFDGFELALRAILGQQVTVRGASTLANRLVAALGVPAETPHAQLHCHWPTPEQLAGMRSAPLVKLGLRTMTVKAILGLSKAVADGELSFAPAVDLPAVLSRLEELPGIGPWTAQYIAMRALRWPDAFPAGDLGLRKATHADSEKELTRISENWRPWRAYAAMHLWESLQ